MRPFKNDGHSVLDGMRDLSMGFPLIAGKIKS